MRAALAAQPAAAAASTTIVALSADESERIVLEMLNAGAVAHLRKGVSRDELVALLGESLRAQGLLPSAPGDDDPA